MNTERTPFPGAKPDPYCSGALREKALRSLVRRMTGYTLREVKTTYEYDADGNRRIKSETVVRKRVGPDLAAITFALTNLDPQRWRPKSSPQAGQPSGGEDASDWSQLPEQLLRDIAETGDG